MKTMRRNLNALIVALLVVGAGGCAGMSERDRNTAYGATAGGVAGAVLSGGSPIGTLGGAAAGGFIGNAVSDDEDDERRRHHRRH